MNQNEIAKNWGKQTLTTIKGRYISMIRSARRSGEGLDSLKVAYGQELGEIERISYKFKRHLVFVHKGAGRGYGGGKGSSWLDAKGARVKTNPKSLGKMGTGRRQAKEWLNPVLDREVPKLADELLKAKIDVAMKAIAIS